MSDNNHHTFAGAAVQRPWDARFARWLVEPLQGTRVSPNHLTTIRLFVGMGAAACFLPGEYVWSNLAALLLVISNFLDHTDGELARLTGKTSRFGHFYDLSSDAVVTILLFLAIGIGVGDRPGFAFDLPPALIGGVAGCAIALIFYVRMRIEDLAGKGATRQATVGGFETEDILYLIPLATLANGLLPVLLAASVCAPLYAAWVLLEYRRAVRLPTPAARASSNSGAAR